MNPTIRCSESLPSLHSFQSLQKRLNESHQSSLHLLAYLAQDSARSMNSTTSHELNLCKNGPTSEPSACHEAWSEFIQSKPFKLRPLSNFGVDLPPNNVPTNRTEASRFGAATTRPRRRPPPLELDPRIISSRKENVVPLGARPPGKPKFSPNENGLDSSSPWCILNQFPTPPTTPLLIRGSKTSTSLSKLSRKTNNVPPSPASIPKDYPKERMEDQPAVRVLGKKRQHSLGSIGKVFKNTSSSIPYTPPPISPAWLQSDPMSEGASDAKSASGLQRRDTFKSRLFSIGTSPKARLRDLGAGDRKVSSQTNSHTVSRNGNRSVSESARKSLAMRQNSKPIEPRSRSVSQPAQSKYKGDKMEPDTPGPSDDVPSLPIDLEKHLIIPERRTRSPSYINLYVPPWKQASPSPTQTVFLMEGGVSSTTTTPIGGMFELPEETMYLPACGSVRSLTVELDPFGAGEPSSFFRSEYGAPMDNIEVDQDTSIFYRTFGLGTGTLRKRWSVQRSMAMYHVPDIVVSSSQGLEELKQRDWVLSD